VKPNKEAIKNQLQGYDDSQNIEDISKQYVIADAKYDSVKALENKDANLLEQAK